MVSYTPAWPWIYVMCTPSMPAATGTTVVQVTEALSKCMRNSSSSKMQMQSGECTGRKGDDSLMTKKTINVLQGIKVRSVGLGQTESWFYISKKGQSLHSLLDEWCLWYPLLSALCIWVMLCFCNHGSLSWLWLTVITSALDTDINTNLHADWGFSPADRVFA